MSRRILHRKCLGAALALTAVVACTWLVFSTPALALSAGSTTTVKVMVVQSVAIDASGFETGAHLSPGELQVQVELDPLAGAARDGAVEKHQSPTSGLFACDFTQLGISVIRTMTRL